MICFEKVETSSESSVETESSDEEVNYVQQTHFMNMKPLSEYEKNRDKSFINNFPYTIYQGRSTGSL